MNKVTDFGGCADVVFAWRMLQQIQKYVCAANAVRGLYVVRCLCVYVASFVLFCFFSFFFFYEFEFFIYKLACKLVLEPTN